MFVEQEVPLVVALEQKATATQTIVSTIQSQINDTSTLSVMPT